MSSKTLQEYYRAVQEAIDNLTEEERDYISKQIGCITEAWVVVDSTMKFKSGEAPYVAVYTTEEAARDYGKADFIKKVDLFY